MANKQPLSLTQLARLQFDKAALHWWVAFGLELFTGILVTIFAILQPSKDWAILCAGLTATLLGVSYVIRLCSEAIYDDAETMRRQSALTEGLGWELDGADIAEWLHRAGKDAQLAFRIIPKDECYFSSTTSPGPIRLAEITLESAFYTRMIYTKLRALLWRLLFLSSFALLVVVVSALTRAVPETADVIIAVWVLVFIPTILSLDIIGWVIRLARLKDDIKAIEASISRALLNTDLDATQVLRMVAEYNCQVIQGMPIPNRLFSSWHDEIAELWGHRNVSK